MLNPALTHKQKIFVLDTSVILHNPQSVLSFQENAVCLPFTVLEELDNIKDRAGKSVSLDARAAIRIIYEIVAEAPIDLIRSGLPIPGAFDLEGNQGHLFIIPDQQINVTQGAVLGEYNDSDNKILNACIYLQEHYTNTKTILVSNDLNMVIKGRALGIQVENYKHDRQLDDIDLLYTGYQKFENDFWSCVDQVNAQHQGRSDLYQVARSVFKQPLQNQYFFDENGLFAKIRKVDEQSVIFQHINDNLMHNQCWGISPRTPYQAMALHQLTDPNLDLNILIGSAGTGKTLLAVAAALELIIEKKIYSRLIVARTNAQMDEPIGFLPGTETEKVKSLLGGVIDSLEFLHSQDHSSEFSLDYVMQKANIEFKSVNYMRGRSISNAVIIYDELQNATSQQIRGLLSRAGENTKVICLGNLKQIDNHFLNALSSGLTTLVEHFKHYEGCSILHMQGVVRSRLAKFTEEQF